MAKLLDPKQTVRYEIPGQERLPEDSRVAFHLAVPTVHGRAALARAIARAGGRNWSLMQQLGCLRAGVRHLLGEHDPESCEAGLAAIDAYRDWLDAYSDRILAGEFEGEEGEKAFAAATDEMAAHDQAIAAIADVVAEGYAPYANMRGDLAAFPLIRGIESARLFLMDWEGVAGELRRGREGVTDESLAHLTEHQLILIGSEVERMTRPTEAEAKNSVSPSPGASIPTDSATASTPA